MLGIRVTRVGVVGFLCALLASPGWAQQTLSGLAGTVKDAAGVPVAGASVEAASPALIEKVRDVVTDSPGQYKITDLEPGVYSVTVKAPGFSGVMQTGIELPAGFTATVNADLKPGNPEQTITVTATVSLVDTRSTTAEPSGLGPSAPEGRDHGRDRHHGRQRECREHGCRRLERRVRQHGQFAHRPREVRREAVVRRPAHREHGRQPAAPAT